MNKNLENFNLILQKLNFQILDFLINLFFTFFKIVFFIFLIFIFKNLIYFFLSKFLKTAAKIEEELKHKNQNITHSFHLELINKSLKDLLNYLAYFFIFIVILSEMGVNWKTLLLGVGVLGVIISLSFQSFLTDIIEGFYIILENRFRVGDRVKTGNIEGVVKDFNLRRTILIDEEGNLHRIPNSQMKMITIIKKN